MCGITGWIDWYGAKPTNVAVVAQMTTALTHRGPDEYGLWSMEYGTLGHRRLSIIDPENGQQPMTHTIDDASYAIVYNGELYNTASVRAELMLRGYRFRTACDTEVILMGCIEWGAHNAATHFDGIFAFAFWDGRNHQLSLVRDRLGVKPLFYAFHEHSILFGSEPKALLAHPELEPVLDASGLSQWLTFGPARTPGHALFRGITEVLPGQCLTVRPDRVTKSHYWSLPVKEHSDDAPTTIATVRELLTNIVRKQLVSDVPIGTLLSGGIDSSAITALAHRASAHRPFQTFSVSYEHTSGDTTIDAPYIAEMVRTLGTQHIDVCIPSAQLFDALAPALCARDVPGMADIDASLWLFFQEIRANVTVALSGEGADELFGGYPWFERPFPPDRFPWSAPLSQRLAWVSSEWKHDLSLEAYHQEQMNLFWKEVVLLPGESGTVAGEKRALNYAHITRFLPTLLERKDRMSMACGLEVRVPFCDHQLVEYVYNIPWSMKAHGNVPKSVLRQAVATLLPERIIHRRKTPYPKTQDTTYAQRVRDAVRTLLHEGTSPLCALIDRTYVTQLTNSGLSSASTPLFGQLMSETQWLAYLWQCHLWLTNERIRFIV